MSDTPKVPRKTSHRSDSNDGMAARTYRDEREGRVVDEAVATGRAGTGEHAEHTHFKLSGVGSELITSPATDDQLVVGTVNVRGKCGNDARGQIVLYVAEIFSHVKGLHILFTTECGLKAKDKYAFETALNGACRCAELDVRLTVIISKNGDAETTHNVVAIVRRGTCDVAVAEEGCYHGRSLLLNVTRGSADCLSVMGVYGFAGQANANDIDERKALVDVVRQLLRNGKGKIALGDWNTVNSSLDRKSGNTYTYDKAPTALHRVVQNRLTDLLGPSELDVIGNDFDDWYFTYEGERQGVKSRVDRIYASRHVGVVSAVHGPVARQWNLDHRPVFAKLSLASVEDNHRVTTEELPENSPYRGAWKVRRSECTAAARNKLEKQHDQRLESWSVSTCRTLADINPNTYHGRAAASMQLDAVWSEVMKRAKECLGSAPKKRTGTVSKASRGDKLQKCKALAGRAATRQNIRQQEAYTLRAAARAVGIQAPGVSTRTSSEACRAECTKLKAEVEAEIRTERKRARLRREARLTQLAARAGTSIRALLKSVTGSQPRRRMAGTAEEVHDMYVKRFDTMPGANARFLASGGTIGTDEKGYSTYKFSADSEGSTANESQPSGSRRDELKSLFVVLNDKITRLEFDEAMRRIGQYKAPGPDGWTAGALRTLPKRIRDVLYEIAVVIHRTSIIPLAYKSATVICLPKGAGEFTATKHRPITLLPHIFKIQEFVYLCRIKKVLEEHPEIFNNSHQCGGLRGRSTHDASRLLQAMIEDAISRYESAVDPQSPDYKGIWIFSSDVAAAFDGITEASKETALRRLGLPERFLRFIKASQTNAPRRVRFDDGTFSKIFYLKRGVSQGSMISPFIWLAFMAMWLDFAERDGRGYKLKTGETIPGPAYMDDVISAAHCESDMHEMVTAFTKFLRAHSASMSVPKTVLVARPQRRAQGNLPPINVDIVDWTKPAEKQEQTHALRYANAQTQIKYVGMYFALDRRSKRSLAIAHKTIKELARLVEMRAVNPRIAMKVVSTVIERKISYIFNTVIVPSEVLKEWSDILRKAVASAFGKKSKYFLARAAYHGKLLLDRQGLEHIQLAELIALTKRDFMAAGNAVTRALRQTYDAGEAKWRRRGLAINDHELVCADDTRDTHRATRLRALFAEFGVTVRACRERTAAVPLGRRSPRLGERWSQDECDYTIYMCIYTAVHQWIEEDTTYKTKQVSPLLQTLYSEAELRAEVKAERTSREHIRPKARALAHKLALGGVFTWEHVLRGNKVMTWAEVKMCCGERGYSMRDEKAWTELVNAVCGRNKTGCAKADLLLKVGAAAAGRTFGAEHIPCFTLTTGRLEVSVMKHSMRAIQGVCDHHDIEPSDEDVKRLAWNLTASRWGVPISNLRKEYTARSRKNERTGCSAADYGTGLLQLLNREGSCDGEQPLPAVNTAAILTKFYEKTTYIHVPFVKVESPVDELSTDQMRRMCRRAGPKSAMGRRDLMSMISQMRVLPKALAEVTGIMRAAILEQQEIEAGENVRELWGLPLKSACYACYESVWKGLKMRKLQSSLKSVILGSDGSLTPASYGKDAKGGFAVAIGSVDGVHTAHPDVAIAGKLPMWNSLESSTTAELYGIASQAATAVSVPLACGEADSTSALKWASRGALSLRPNDVAKSPASGQIEMLLICADMRARNGLAPMQWGKVKAHVSGLRTDSEVTNERVDKGSKEAADGANSPIEFGATTLLAGTAVVAMGGQEEAAPPKQMVRKLRHDMALSAAELGNAMRQAMLHAAVEENSVDETSLSVLIGKKSRGRDRKVALCGLLEFAQSNNHGGAGGDKHCPLCKAQGQHVVGDVQHATQCMSTTHLARTLANRITGIVLRAIRREDRMIEEALSWRERTRSGKCDVITVQGEDEWCRICDCDEPPPQHDCSCEPKVFVSERTLNTVRMNCNSAERSVGHVEYICRLARGMCTRGTQMRWGSCTSTSCKVSTAAMRHVIPELWMPLCATLRCQVEANTTAATRGAPYDESMRWTSELDEGVCQQNANDWDNIICVLRPADEEIAATLEHYGRWIDATPPTKSRRVTLVLVRGSRKTDAQVHSDANEAWEEFLRIEDGHRITRPIGIHTSSQRLPSQEDVGLIVLVRESANAAKTWPVVRETMDALISAMDEVGIERDEFMLRAPNERVWTEWWRKKRSGERKAPKSFRDINPCFDERQMENMYEVKTPKPPVQARVGWQCSVRRKMDRRRERRLGNQAQAYDVQVAEEELWEWQEKNNHSYKPRVSNEELPRRLTSLGFLNKTYLGSAEGGYPITGANRRRTVAAISRAVVSNVAAARRVRNRLLQQLSANAAEQNVACTACNRTHRGTGVCTMCKNRGRVLRRREAARQRLMTPGTSVRVEVLSGRPIDAQRMAIDVAGDTLARPYVIGPIRSACTTLKIATVVGGKIHLEDQLQIRPRPGGPARGRRNGPYDPTTWRVTGRCRLTVSRSEARDMVDRHRRRTAAGAESGSMRLGTYGVRKEVAIAQETPFRSISTRRAPPRVHSRMISIRQIQRQTIKRLSRVRKGTKVAELSLIMRKELSTSRTHWLLFSLAELRRACTSAELRTAGKRETLAQRLSDGTNYGHFAEHLKHCTDAADVHGRGNVHFPPMEVVQLATTWTARDVQLRPRSDGDKGRRKQRRKQNCPRRLSVHGTVRDETWRITPGLLEEEREKTEDEKARDSRKKSRSASRGDVTTKVANRNSRLRTLVFACITGHSIIRNGRKMKLLASADEEEIVIVWTENENAGTMEEENGLIGISLEATVNLLAEALPVWKTVQQMLQIEGYTDEEAEKASGISRMLSAREGVDTYQQTAEARRGDVCIFPAGYFKGVTEEQYGVILTSRGLGTGDSNKTKREFVDVALPDEYLPWELNITDNEWESVIRLGNLRTRA